MINYKNIVNFKGYMIKLNILFISCLAAELWSFKVEWKIDILPKLNEFFLSRYVFQQLNPVDLAVLTSAKASLTTALSATAPDAALSKSMGSFTPQDLERLAVCQFVCPFALTSLFPDTSCQSSSRRSANSFGTMSDHISRSRS